jgi:hypothetical protein
MRANTTSVYHEARARVRARASTKHSRARARTRERERAESVGTIHNSDQDETQQDAFKVLKRNAGAYDICTHVHRRKNKPAAA